MGQYFEAINTETLERMNPHQYDSFSKLTEHGWVGNSFVGAVMRRMMPGNPWYQSPVAWVGDYYGDEDGETDFQTLSEKEGKKVRKYKTLTTDEQKKAFLINHTKSQYVSYNDLPEDYDGWMLNPLCILTAMGNGRGGGDYRGPDEDKVGIWATDILSVDFDIEKWQNMGYTKLDVHFID